MCILEFVHGDLVARENATDFLDLFDSDFKIVSLLEDKSLKFHICELLVERFEEFQRLFDDGISQVDKVISHLKHLLACLRGVTLFLGCIFVDHVLNELLFGFHVFLRKEEVLGLD